MKKQTITFTVLPKSFSGAAGNGRLQLAAFVAPRLWNDDPAEQSIVHLQEYPAFLDWPDQVAAMQFRVAFQGGPPAALPATVASATALRADLWQALFPDHTPVKPFRFDNAANVPIETIDTGWLEPWLQGVYRRAGTDAQYGAGADMPSLSTMQDDPDLKAVARPYQPEEEYTPPDTPGKPVDIGQAAPEPPVIPLPEDKGCLHGCLSGCLPGCLTPFFIVLNPIFKLLGLKPPFQPHPHPAHPHPHPAHPHAADAGSVAAAPVPEPAVRDGGVLPGGSPLPPDPTLLAKAKIDQVVNFLKPLSDVDAVLPPLTDEEWANLLDFHEAVALCCDYPTLMPALGIVVNLEVDWDAAIPLAGLMWLEVDAPQVTAASAVAGVDHYSHLMRTHYELAPNRFVVPPRPVAAGQPESKDGLLLLSDAERYKIVQADVVGATVKVQNAATIILAPGGQPADPEPLPALRTAGLSVVQADLAGQLYTGYVNALGLNNCLAQADGSPMLMLDPTPGHPVVAQPALTNELWAEDVVRGYRMDVRDLDSASQKWRSLHQRTGECRFTRVHPDILFPVEDEGFLQTAVAEPSGSAPTVQRVHDAVATWTGWSLSAVRPGKALVESTDPNQSLQNVTNEPKTQFKMVASFIPAAGSLPRLRFGHTYQVRVRTVDLTGNSVFGPGAPEFQAAHPEQDAAAVTLRRYEPVASPAVVLREPPIEGESVERLVVRSDLDDPNSSVNRPATERHIVPPKESQQMAELHGQFDQGHVMRQDQAAYDLASREAGTLTHGLNLVTGELELLPGVGFPAGSAIGSAPGEGPGAVAGNNPVFWQSSPAFPLAYLPDDLARSVVLLGLPGMPPDEVQDGVNRIPFDGPWPDRRPFRLRVKGIPLGQKPKPPAWITDPFDFTQRCLEVELPPAGRQTVRISSALDPADLERMALWDWATQPPTANTAQIVAAAHQGRNWELMPYRELELVHAVQKPLAMPAVHIQGGATNKQEKDTFVTFDGGLDLHAASTGKVDLLALWEDPVDDPPRDPAAARSQAVVGEWQIVDPQNDALPITGVRHELGDTHYHAVTYLPRATTRFREYLPASILGDPDQKPTQAQLDLITTPTQAEVEGGALTTGQLVDVLNSARPAAPEVQFVLPTFGKVEETTDTVWPENLLRHTRIRRGNGLRVYLKRPWFSSGAGELLGIVFQTGAAFSDANPGEAMQPFVTQWANDPIWASDGADLIPTDANFVNPAVPIQDAILEENGAAVRVAGYATEFVKLDEEHKLRYADVGLNLGAAYTPMIRLALVRFQPKSVNQATSISRVVRTDFCQVLPDRTLTLTHSKLANNRSYHLKLEGLAPAAEQRGVSVRIEAQVEPGEFGWQALQDVVPQPQATAALWEGTFELPTPPASKPYRVVVEEYEKFVEEYPSPEGGVIQVLNGRVVYADIVEL